MSDRSRSSWDAPGAVAVADGVHRIPLPLPGDGLRAVNVYAVEDGGRIAIIDAGSSHAASVSALKRGLAEIGAAISDISIVLTTHGHYDHYGLATTLADSARAGIATGECELSLLHAATRSDLYRHSVQHRRQWLRRHGAGASLDAADPVERRQEAPGAAWRLPDRCLADREDVELAKRTLRVVWTPGHTRGHIVYHDAANRLLFAGDHVLPHITPSLGFEPFVDGRALELFLESLAVVRELDADLVLPGHGREFADLRGRVDELLDHHDERLAGCVAVLAGADARSANAVAERLTWTRRARSFSELDAFNRMLAVTETVTHLELLVRHGRVQHEDDDGVRTYGLAA